MLASVAELASLSLTWSKTPQDTFCHVVAHIFFLFMTGTIEFSASGPILKQVLINEEIIKTKSKFCNKMIHGHRW